MANNDLRPSIAVLAEHFSGERRVALLPADVRRLSKLAAVTIEHGAGAEAGHQDGAYIETSATIDDRLAIVSSARVILGVRAPSDLSSFQPGTLVVSLGDRDEDVASAPTIAQTTNSACSSATSGLRRRNCFAMTSTSLRKPAVAAARVSSSARASSLPRAENRQPPDRSSLTSVER
jgi:NAD/NADP transhydrogenase alpha subunit